MRPVQSDHRRGPVSGRYAPVLGDRDNAAARACQTFGAALVVEGVNFERISRPCAVEDLTQVDEGNFRMARSEIRRVGCHVIERHENLDVVAAVLSGEGGKVPLQELPAVDDRDDDAQIGSLYGIHHQRTLESALPPPNQ